MDKKYLAISIALQVPAELDKKCIEKIEMRPPTAADVFLATSMTSSEAEKDALLFANLSDTTADFIKSLSFYDYKRIEDAFSLFMLPIAAHLGKRALWFPDNPEGETSTTLLESPSQS